MRQTIAFVAAACAALAACSPEPESPTAQSPPPAPSAPPPPAPPAATTSDVITAERGGFIPEGIEYDEDNGRFLTGSLAEGTIFVIERDGRVVPFIRDAELVSSVGIHPEHSKARWLPITTRRAHTKYRRRTRAKKRMKSEECGEIGGRRAAQAYTKDTCAQVQLRQNCTVRRVLEIVFNVGTFAERWGLTTTRRGVD